MEQEVDIIRTSLRLPRALYDRLAAAAETRGITMHADIIVRLESSLPHEPDHGSAPIQKLPSGGYPNPILRQPAYQRHELPHRLVKFPFIQHAVTNPEKGKAHLVYSDGEVWRYTSDGSVVSTAHD